MTKLNDTQTILLSTASQRDGNIYPLPQLRAPNVTVMKAIASLRSAALVEECVTVDQTAIHRRDGDLTFGLYITHAGLDAIGAGEDQAPSPAADAGVEAGDLMSDEPTPASSPRLTKAALVLGLLKRTDGATLPELIDATGWLPHTTRAALTGLRKKGHAIERRKRDGVTCSLGSGSCRDIAALFIDAVRHLGFGARAVSGYLFDPDAPSDDGGSTHAWAEVYLPCAGWGDATDRLCRSAAVTSAARRTSCSCRFWLWSSRHELTFVHVDHILQQFCRNGI